MEHDHDRPAVMHHSLEGIQKQFLAACIRGQHETVELLLNENLVDSLNGSIKIESGLVAACAAGHVHVALFLLSLDGAHQADVHWDDEAPLRAACAHNHWQLVHKLLTLPMPQCASLQRLLSWHLEDFEAYLPKLLAAMQAAPLDPSTLARSVFVKSMHTLHHKKALSQSTASSPAGAAFDWALERRTLSCLGEGLRCSASGAFQQGHPLMEPCLATVLRIAVFPAVPGSAALIALLHTYDGAGPRSSTVDPPGDDCPAPAAVQRTMAYLLREMVWRGIAVDTGSAEDEGGGDVTVGGGSISALVRQGRRGVVLHRRQLRAP